MWFLLNVFHVSAHVYVLLCFLICCYIIAFINVFCTYRPPSFSLKESNDMPISSVVITNIKPYFCIIFFLLVLFEQWDLLSFLPQWISRCHHGNPNPIVRFFPHCCYWLTSFSSKTTQWPSWVIPTEACLTMTLKLLTSAFRSGVFILIEASD